MATQFPLKHHPPHPTLASVPPRLSSGGSLLGPSSPVWFLVQAPFGKPWQPYLCSLVLAISNCSVLSLYLADVHKRSRSPLLSIARHSGPVWRFSPTTGRRFKRLQSQGSLKANVSICSVAKTQPTNHHFSAFTTRLLSRSCWGTWWTRCTRSPKVNAKMRLFKHKVVRKIP